MRSYWVQQSGGRISQILVMVPFCPGNSVVLYAQLWSKRLMLYIVLHMVGSVGVQRNQANLGQTVEKCTNEMDTLGIDR